MAQLVERSLPTPEVRSLYVELSTLLKRQKYRKRGREWHIKQDMLKCFIKKQGRNTNAFRERKLNGVFVYIFRLSCLADAINKFSVTTLR